MKSRGRMLVELAKARNKSPPTVCSYRDSDIVESESGASREKNAEVELRPLKHIRRHCGNTTEHDTESEFDDSDADPDFDPSPKKKRKLFNFSFSESSDNDETTIIEDVIQEAPVQIYIDRSSPTIIGATSEISKDESHCDDSHSMEVFITGLLTASLENALTLKITNAETTTKSSKAPRKKKGTARNEKYFLLPPCHKCTRQCSNKFEKDHRQSILDSFKKMSFGESRLFLDGHVTQKPVATRTTNQSNNDSATRSARNFSLKFFLPSITQGKIQVCKSMFLHTLGRKTDGMITTHFNAKSTTENGLAKTRDDRGAKSREILQIKKEQTENLVVHHINLFNPVVSHYNLSHAPNRRYLPCELSIRYLWKDYCNIEKHQKIGYDLYRRIFEGQNIGFARPSQDECETCMKHKSHQEELPIEHDLDSCSECVRYNKHKLHYTEARKAYQEDKQRDTANEKVYSVDMQKVLILPKMSSKNSYFVSRLVVFNETFASLKENEDNLCVMWNEAIRGRSAADVASTYYNIIKRADEEVQKFTFWVDNCSAQNKNWTLYTTLALSVNADWGPDLIRMKYFEPGHSFMAADSVHGQISTEMKRHANILDMDELCRIIEDSSRKTRCVNLNFTDFLKFADGSRQRSKAPNGEHNLPFLDKIKILEFRKGSRMMYFKECFTDAEFKSSDFLKKKFALTLPVAHGTSMGLNTEKKQQIIAKLCPLMSNARKRLFWEQLPTNDAAEDLCRIGEM